jgi:RimJ/RimL family protein N-acetyltransferase
MTVREGEIHAFESRAMPTLYARAAEHNVGSHRVLERNGSVKIGEETSWADGAGKDVVEHIYRLD